MHLFIVTNSFILFFLVRIDDQIYKHFRDTFPQLDISIISDGKLKSAASKKKWNPFCNFYENNEGVTVLALLTSQSLGLLRSCLGLQYGNFVAARCL
jgi:hypothetical protein